MSHSTTATSTYVLAKYSKSYPIETQQKHVENDTVEWQHFTNPVIRLVLDIKKSTDLESVRLRILWSMDSTCNSDREVVFEDIDLLSLSCLPRPRVQKQPPQGLPLKAVYRDSVVGIRYLHSPSINSVPVYRRFQISFLSAAAAIEFIDAIRTICPCKANPSTAHILKPMNPPTQRIQATTDVNTVRQNAPAYVQPPITAPSLIQNIPLNAQVPDTRAFWSSSQSFALEPSQPDLRPNVYTSSPLRLESSSLVAPVSSLSHTTLRLSEDNSSISPKSTQIDGYNRQFTTTNLQRQILPSSSPPSSSAKSISNNINNEPSMHHQPHAPDDNTPNSAILASLREATALYDIPRTTLEQLVGDVVREDGFTKLLENINSMWRVKSFLGI